MCGVFAGWRFAYPAYAVSVTWVFPGLIRRSRHQAFRWMAMCGLFAGWRFAYPAYAVSATWFPHA